MIEARLATRILLAQGHTGALGQSHQFLDRLIHQPGDETKRVVNGIGEQRLAGEAGELRLEPSPERLDERLATGLPV
jgi:hypothetical protein